MPEILHVLKDYIIPEDYIMAKNFMCLRFASTLSSRIILNPRTIGATVDSSHKSRVELKETHLYEASIESSHKYLYMLELHQSIYTLFTYYLCFEDVIVQRHDLSWLADIISWPKDLISMYHDLKVS